jgi:hypothetical protein
MQLFRKTVSQNRARHGLGALSPCLLLGTNTSGFGQCRVTKWNSGSAAQALSDFAPRVAYVRKAAQDFQ